MLRSDPSSAEIPEPSPLPDELPAGAGDDDALILWMLSLTPTQRLEAAQGFAESLLALRDGGRS
jgi:hypothetical protein